MFSSRGLGSGRASGVTVPARGVWRSKPGGRIEVRSGGRDGALAMSGVLIDGDQTSVRIALAEQAGVSRTIGVSGDWSLDARHRLKFAVEGARRDRRDRTLTLDGVWEIGKDNELSYRLRRAAGSGRPERRIRLAGYWELWEGKGLRYVLARTQGKTTALEFAGSFRTRSLYPSKGKLLFQIGARGRSGVRSDSLALFGEWKISKDGAVELEWSPGPRGRLRFGATYHLTDRRSVTATLTFPGTSRPTGIELTLKRKLSRLAGEASLSAALSGEEKRLTAALGFAW